MAGRHHLTPGQARALLTYIGAMEEQLGDGRDARYTETVSDAVDKLARIKAARVES